MRLRGWRRLPSHRMSFRRPSLRGTHYPTLDGVRGVAILLVVVHNFSFDDAVLDGFVGRLLHACIIGGWIGVTMFFVLSGFLITGILLDTQHEPGHFRRFYLRRTLRIAPLYYAVLLVAFVGLPLAGIAPASVRADEPSQLWLWCYLSNWVQPFGLAGHAFPHFWSLAVEEQFYLLWPLLTWRRRPETVLRWGLALAVLAPAVRVGLLLRGGTPELAYLWSPCRMDALALGGCAAAALRMPGLATLLAARRTQVLAAASATFVVCVLACRGLWSSSFTMQTLGYSLLAVSFASLVLGLACADLAGDVQWPVRLWRAAPLRVLARYSYGIYIFHKPLQQGIGAPLMQWIGAGMIHSTSANAAYAAGGLAASLALAVLSYHGFEQRFLALKARVS
jgi:peptidoglycan/LPS O-acetylase OafA/YrhL